VLIHEAHTKDKSAIVGVIHVRKDAQEKTRTETIDVTLSGHLRLYLSRVVVCATGVNVTWAQGLVTNTYHEDGIVRVMSLSV
jgi:hypothetical protein